MLKPCAPGRIRIFRVGAGQGVEPPLNCAKANHRITCVHRDLGTAWSRADKAPCTLDEDVSVGVLLESEERYVGFCAAVVEYIADHLRSFDVAVVGSRRTEVTRWDTLGMDEIEETLPISMR